MLRLVPLLALVSCASQHALSSRGMHKVARECARVGAPLADVTPWLGYAPGDSPIRQRVHAERDGGRMVLEVWEDGAPSDSFKGSLDRYVLEHQPEQGLVVMSCERWIACYRGVSPGERCM